LMGGQESLAMLRPRYRLASILQLESPKFTDRELVAFLLLTVAAVGAVRLASVRPRLEVTIYLAVTSFAIAVSILCLLFPTILKAMSPPGRALVAAAIPLGLVVAAFADRLGRPTGGGALNSARAEALLYACVPFIVAVGTAQNVVRQMGYGAVFWAFSAFVLTRAQFQDGAGRIAVSVLLASGLAVTVALVTARTEFPFQQHAALRLQNVPISVGPTAHQALLVDRETARYFTELGAELQRLGFRRGDGMIDMTGQSPGIVFAIGGVALGEPWLLGNYPGSTAFAKRALARVSCEQLVNAWILVAPEGERKISDAVLRSAGLSPRLDSGSAEIRRRSRKDHHVIVPPQKDGATLQSCLRLRATKEAH
jgi:hypothetical protein